MQQKLPQNIQALVGDIGEKLVLLHLAVLCHQTPNWSVFHNLGEAGFDILLLNTVTNERRAIEVKTRQKIYTTSKHRQRIMFQMTAGEYSACDFLVACLLDSQMLFVVPKHELRSITNGRRYRFLVTTNAQGRAHPRFARFHNAWGLLHPDFAGKSSVIEADELDDEDA